jgi:hypothetical protein
MAFSLFRALLKNSTLISLKLSNNFIGRDEEHSIVMHALKPKRPMLGAAIAKVMMQSASLTSLDLSHNHIRKVRFDWFTIAFGLMCNQF